MTDKDIQTKYIAWRIDPINDRFDDCVFCGEVDKPNTISLDKLKSLKTPEVIRAIMRKPPSDEEFFNLLEQTLRLCYDKALNGNLPVKSLEGAINSITALLKQRQLDNGKPTERVEFTELEKKTSAELHQFIMGRLRSGRN